MPGKLYDGTIENSAQPIKDSKAYCEGRASAVGGGVVGDNPHEAGSESNAAWAAGLASWKAAPATGGPDCCADAYGGGHA